METLPNLRPSNFRRCVAALVEIIGNPIKKLRLADVIGQAREWSISGQVVETAETDAISKILAHA